MFKMHRQSFSNGDITKRRNRGLLIGVGKVTCLMISRIEKFYWVVYRFEFFASKGQPPQTGWGVSGSHPLRTLPFSTA